MRCSRGFASVFFLLYIFPSIASAEIKIKVVDPQDAAVAGAEVQLLKLGKPAPAAIQSTSAEGLAIFRQAPSSSYRVLEPTPGHDKNWMAIFRQAPSSSYRVQVLAPG